MQKRKSFLLTFVKVSEKIDEASKGLKSGVNLNICITSSRENGCSDRMNDKIILWHTESKKKISIFVV